MIRRNLAPLAVALALALASPVGQAARFVYEGRLDDAGRAAEGRYDLKLTAYGDATLGSTLAAPVTLSGVEVRDGRFRIDVDLPLVKSDQVWLEVAVRGAGEPTFASIPGRSKAIAATLVGQCWSTTGDSGSNPAVNFLGTTDAQPLELRVNNQTALRIEPGFVPNVIAGAPDNRILTGVTGGTIGGGGGLLTIGNHAVGDDHGVVAGGFRNRAGDFAGDFGDRAFATVGGGFGNTASGLASTVSGGSNNTASGAVSTVGGGEANCAGAAGSWAGGRGAKVRPGLDPGGSGSCAGLTYPGGDGDVGSFVWSDSQPGNFVSGGPNQFLIRADGGLLFNTNTRVAIADDVIFRARQNGGDADMDLRLVTRTGKSVAFYVSDSSGSLFITPPNLNANANRLIVTGGTVGNATLSNGGTWTNASSRTFKEGFGAVDTIDVLNRLLNLPITTWEYIGSAEGLHLGPVAEDFKAAFGLAGDGQSIATVDADGVALAAIQGLNAKLESENASLRQKLDTVRAENDALRARMDRIEAHLTAPAD